MEERVNPKRRIVCRRSNVRIQQSKSLKRQNKLKPKYTNSLTIVSSRTKAFGKTYGKLPKIVQYKLPARNASRISTFGGNLFGGFYLYLIGSALSITYLICIFSNGDGFELKCGSHSRFGREFRSFARRRWADSVECRCSAHLQGCSSVEEQRRNGEKGTTEVS